MSSAGASLGYLNKGWPDPDADGILQGMREAKAAYARLSPSERRLAQPLGDKDRMRFEEEQFSKPEGTLDLRISSRGLPFKGMTSFDQRHPMYFHLDRLWFKPSEWRAFIPADGRATEVTGPARTRLVLLSHHQAGQSAWWEEHIVGGKTVSRVVARRGDLMDLEIEGTYTMRADSEWCKDSYEGRMMAHATFDMAGRRFTRFDLAMLGRHTVGRRMENLHVGDLTAKIAASASLNPLRTASDRMLPQNWKYGYGLPWCRTP